MEEVHREKEKRTERKEIKYTEEKRLKEEELKEKKKWELERLEKSEKDKEEDEVGVEELQGGQSVSMKGKRPCWEMIDGFEPLLAPGSAAQSCQGQFEANLTGKRGCPDKVKTNENPSYMVAIFL